MRACCEWEIQQCQSLLSSLLTDSSLDNFFHYSGCSFPNSLAVSSSPQTRSSPRPCPHPPLSSTLFSIGYFTNFSLLYSVVNLYVYVTLSLQLENKLLEARNLSYLSFSLFSSYDMWFTNLWDQWISRVFHLFLFCNHSYCSCYSRVIPSNVILHGNLCKEKKKKTYLGGQESSCYIFPKYLLSSYPLLTLQNTYGSARFCLKTTVFSLYVMVKQGETFYYHQLSCLTGLKFVRRINF